MEGNGPAVPITVRQLEALIRITEALARMTLATHATDAHVQQAVQLFNVSTAQASAGFLDPGRSSAGLMPRWMPAMQAASAGLVGEAMTDEDKEAMKAIIAQITRRLPATGEASMACCSCSVAAGPHPASARCLLQRKSESRLVEDVYKAMGGTAERSAIQRALVMMVRSGELKYAQERKMVYKAKPT